VARAAPAERERQPFYRNIREAFRVDLAGTHDTDGGAVMDDATHAALQRLAALALHQLTPEERAAVRAFLGAQQPVPQ